MSTPWSSYAPGRAWDEAMDVEGQVREPYAAVYREIDQMSHEDLHSRAEALASTYLAQGVTFDHAGEERPFPLDIVPRVVSSEDWEIIDPGVAQRVRTVEAFLADVYGSQRCVADHVVPRRLITSSQHFRRAAAGIDPPGGVRVLVSGIDLVRDQHGICRVLEDNVRVPSGVSYVLSNRRAMSQMFSELFATMGIRPVLEYSQRLRKALTRVAPDGIDDPTIVLLTPGVYNSAYYEHSLLARTMGVELVEGRDLEVVAGRVYMRTTAGRRASTSSTAVSTTTTSTRSSSGPTPRSAPRPHHRGPPRPRHPRQRGRQRRRRRQARLHATCPTSCATTSARSPSCPTSTRGGSRRTKHSRRSSTGSTSSS